MMVEQEEHLGRIMLSCISWVCAGALSSLQSSAVCSLQSSIRTSEESSTIGLKFSVSVLSLTLERPGGRGGGILPSWQNICVFNMKTGFKDSETPWLSQFYTNESNGTKFSTCFYIGMGLRDFFVRTSLGENGYFIGFWDFLPYFKLILHTSKWILCPQKVWKLFIYVLGSIQHNL